MPDKLNCVDYRWFLVRTLPGRERELARLIDGEKSFHPNILQAYCPTHTTVNVQYNGHYSRRPLFDGYVFVLATQGALMDFLRCCHPEATLRYNRRPADGKASPCTIPENQMRAFMDFNENYADKVVVLERPFSDYAFNVDGPNETVRVIDGPLAGCEGYICRFRRRRGLVFQVQGVEPGSRLTVSYPDISTLHVVRLRNAADDRSSSVMEKVRAADRLVDLLQGCGCGEQTLPLLYDIVTGLAERPSLTELCRRFRLEGKEELRNALEGITAEEASELLNLARYEHDHPGYVRRAFPKLVIRPFLTPSYDRPYPVETERRERDFTEIVRRVEITERVYRPGLSGSREETTAYFAHVGLMERNGRQVLFCNWDGFLREYFLTAGAAHNKLVGGREQHRRLIDSFHNFAPTLYGVLTDSVSPVKAVKDFTVGDRRLNVMTVEDSNLAAGIEKLIDTCTAICRELTTTLRLAVWRRFLRTVWIHE